MANIEVEGRTPVESRSQPAPKATAQTAYANHKAATGSGEETAAEPLQSALLAKLEALLDAPADPIDSLLQEELEKALEGCQNKEWAEMIRANIDVLSDQDFVQDIVGDDDYSL